MTAPKRLLETAGPFERELLSAGRHDAISPQRRSALLATYGVGAPVAELRSSVEVSSKFEFPSPTDHPIPPLTSSGAGLQLGGKALLAALGAGGGAALAIWAAVSSNDPAPRDSGSEPTQVQRFEVERSSNDERREDPIPPLEIETTPTPDGVVPEAEPETTTPAPARKSASRGDGLAAELALIDEARRTLTRRDAAGSLRRLDEYARQYPKGRLRSESTLLRIQALSESGDRAAAVRLGKAELARSPNGPYARRIRSLIDGSSGEP